MSMKERNDLIKASKGWFYSFEDVEDNDLLDTLKEQIKDEFEGIMDECDIPIDGSHIFNEEIKSLDDILNRIEFLRDVITAFANNTIDTFKAAREKENEMKACAA